MAELANCCLYWWQLYNRHIIGEAFACSVAHYASPVLTERECICLAVTNLALA